MMTLMRACVDESLEEHDDVNTCVRMYNVNDYNNIILDYVGLAMHEFLQLSNFLTPPN